MTETDDLIAKLAKDAAPVARLPRPAARLGLWLAAAFAACAAGVWLFGCRADLAAAVVAPAFAARLLVILTVCALAGLGALASAVPGADGGASARLLPGAALAGWLILILVEVARNHSGGGAGASDGIWRWHCLGHIAALAAAPGVLLFFMLRRAAPVRPALSGWLAALAVACAGNAGTQFLCSNDAPLHALVSHFLPIVILAAAGAAAGRRALRW